RVKLGKAMHHAVSLLRSASRDILNGYPHQSLNTLYALRTFHRALPGSTRTGKTSVIPPLYSTDILRSLAAGPIKASCRSLGNVSHAFCTSQLGPLRRCHAQYGAKDA